MTPAVSIIMNCLNAEKELPAALKSIYDQTYDDWEIIFLDNGSRDKSYEIAKAFGSKLRLYKNKTTVPLGEARNQAIAQAKGNFIAFLDCDDYWKPQKLALQVEILENNKNVGLVCTDTEIFDDRHVLGNVFSRSKPGRGNVFEELMLRQWISMSSAMIRKKALDSLLTPDLPGKWFDERLEMCEEADVFYRIAHDWELDFVPEVLTGWRVHPESSTFRKFDKFVKETRIILAKHRNLYPEYDQKYHLVARILENRANFQEAIAVWRKGDNSYARKLIKQSASISIKNSLFWLLTFLPGSTFDVIAKLYFRLPAFMRK